MKKTFTIRCHVCNCSVKIKVSPYLPKSIRYDFVARDFGWQSTMMLGKIFICCPKCIEESYDPNGSLGFLKKDKQHLLIEDEEGEKYVK